MNATPTAHRRHHTLDVVLYGVILQGEILRLVLPFFYNPIDAIWSDPGRWWGYVKLGVETPPMALIDPVFYQAWLSFIAKFTLDIPPLVALYAGLLSAITPWLWYRFLRELLPTRRQALIGWAILAWLPSWIGIYSYFMTETLLLTLLGLAMWLSWRALRKGTVDALVLAALVWTIAGLTRAVAGPLAAVVTLFLLWHQPRRVVATVSVGLLVLSVLLPLSYRSWVKTGSISPLGQPGMNQLYALSGKREVKIHYQSRERNIGFVYGFASPSTGSQPFAPFSEYRNPRLGTLDLYIDLDDQPGSWERERQRVVSQTVDRGFLRATELISLFFGTSWPDNNPQRWMEWLANWLRFLWAPLFIVAVFLLFWRTVTGERRHAPILLSLLITWLVVQGLMLFTVNEGRYRKPIEGIVIAGLLCVLWRRPTEEGSSDSGMDPPGRGADESLQRLVELPRHS